MCHKLCDTVQPAIARQVLEPPNGVNCVAWHRVWDLEAIFCCWSLEVMFHVFPTFYPECHFAWVMASGEEWLCGRSSCLYGFLCNLINISSLSESYSYKNKQLFSSSSSNAQRSEQCVLKGESVLTTKKCVD